MSRTASARNSLKDSAQSPPKRTKALPAAAFASCAWRLRASPAKTRGGRSAISVRAFSSSSGSSYLGCWSASRCFHESGDQSLREAPVAEICLSPRSAASYSALGCWGRSRPCLEDAGGGGRDRQPRCPRRKAHEFEIMVAGEDISRRARRITAGARGRGSETRSHLGAVKRARRIARRGPRRAPAGALSAAALVSVMAAI